MKLSKIEDIEAPIAFVFAALSDFEGWERAAMRRGADVSRTDSLTKPGRGMGWQVDFSYRGKPRKLKIGLVALVADQQISFAGEGKSAIGSLHLDVAEMGPRRTRVNVIAEIKPRTLAARLFIQSLRLAKGAVTRRFDLRVGQIGADIEDRYRTQIKAS